MSLDGRRTSHIARMQTPTMSGLTRLHSIHYETGRIDLVDALLHNGIAPSVVSNLKDKGVQSFSVFDTSPSESINRCIQRCIDSSKLAPDEIDTVLLVTESFDSLHSSGMRDHSRAGRPHRQVRDWFFDRLYALGVRRAMVLTLGYGACANLLHAVATAESWLRTGKARHAMVVMVEHCPDTASRLGDDGASVTADGVAAFMLSAGTMHFARALEVEHIGFARFDMQRGHQDGGDMLLEAFRATKHAAADCYEACSVQPADYRWLVMGDYNIPTSRAYAKLLGFSTERAFLANVGRRGHIPFDAIMNLADLEADPAAWAAGDRVLLHVGGPLHCGVISLKAATQGAHHVAAAA